MAGHSKWANIRHRKQIVDAKKGQQFHKVIKEIQNTLLLGNNPRTNAQLRTALSKAKAINLPKKTIDRLLTNFQMKTTQSSTFWTGGLFAKRVFLLLRMHDHQQKATLNELQKVARKTKLEILPFLSISHMFVRVITFKVIDLTEIDLQTLIEKFTVYDFVVAGTQTTLFFTDFSNTKQLLAFFTDCKITVTENIETFLPKEKVKIEKNLHDELLICKEKVFTQLGTTCLEIIDNLKN